MKKRATKALLAVVLSLGNILHAHGQDSTRNELVLSLRYFIDNNKLMYVQVNTKSKIKTKWTQIGNITVKLFLDAESDSSVIGTVKTDAKGAAFAFIPPALKNIWESSPTHTVAGATEATKDFDAVTGEVAVTKTKMVIDTLTEEGKKMVTVQVLAQKDSEWIAAPEVEMKVGIKRLGGILPAGEQDTYTTDSTGRITVEMNKDSLPGDTKGNIVLVAKVEDNDLYGNLLIERTVPWGTPLVVDDTFFNKRTLWSTRFRTPPWLLFMAYTIVIGVWSTILYQVWQIVRIKRLGTQNV